MINKETPLAMLTIGQLDEFLDAKFKANQKTTSPKKYVYGLEGICSLFNCRLNKAQELKKGVIRDAVIQHGRKIMVDVEKALELYEASKEKNNA